MSDDDRPFDATQAWPRLPLDDWVATRDTVHMWSQIVGKVRLALAPMVNHWWNTTLYVDASGLTTGLMPYRDGGVEVAFDFVRHALHITTTDGRDATVDLPGQSVASFHDAFFDRLHALDVHVEILDRPV